jgi:TM2 domain-containing membrane protein YozV
MFDKPDETTNESQNSERVGFCQDCGRPLTRETVRVVGSGIFCESCLEARLSGSPQATGSATAQNPTQAAPSQGPGAAVPPPVGPLPSEPSPLLAWLLGLIPGVGAMYNGQFAKGIVHLIVFVVLVSLADSVNGIFGLFVAGWVFYQAFEAYHTAKARIEGTPLPNAFGFNDIGDRMGFGKNWPGSATRPPATPVTSWTPGQPAASSTSTPTSWAGYVPPTQFGAGAATQQAATAEATAEAIRQQAYRDTGFAAAPPYAQTYTGTTGTDMPDIAAPPVAPARRFPTGAIWLIALGLVFLLANIDSSFFHISGRWLFPVLLAGLSIWAFVRRLGWLGGVNRLTGSGLASAQFVCMLRGPVMLMTLAILFALQAAHVWTFGQTWPILVITFGALLLLERSIGRPSYVPPASSFIPGTPQTSGYATPVTEPRVPHWPATDDSAKGGQ